MTSSNLFFFREDVFLQAFIKVLYACKKGAASINFCAGVFNFMHQSITLHHDAIKTVLYQRKDFDDETNLLVYRYTFLCFINLFYRINMFCQKKYTLMTNVSCDDIIDEKMKERRSNADIP